MVERMIVEIPAELASSLIDERVARKPMTWRGADIVSVLTLAADLTSTMTAVIVSRSAIAEFARRLVGGFAKKAANERNLTITVRSGGKTQVIVKSNDAEGVRELSAHIELILRAAGTERQ